MSRLARGDRTAFDGLYLALRERALRVARFQVGHAEAQDVAQRVLERVFAHASDFTPGRPCLPWFYAIVGNELRADRRRSARFVLDDAPALGLAAPDADTNTEAKLLERELERALEAAVAELDTDSADAIAGLLGRAKPPDLKPATLRKRLSRAYAKLRLLLGTDHAG
jgi:DNA-directed RNA polymerase specialized sigma24 family protein